MSLRVKLFANPRAADKIAAAESSCLSRHVCFRR